MCSSRALSWKEVFFRRSAISFWTSMQPAAIPPACSNRGFSASIPPFSATMQAPEKYMSVVDSPGPAEA